MIVKYNPDQVMMAASPRQKPRLVEIGRRWSDDTLLAALQVLAEARGRLRGSPHGRTLVEIAILRVARLDDLADLSEVVARLASIEAGAPGVPILEKKKLAVAEPRNVEAPKPPVLSDPAPVPVPVESPGRSGWGLPEIAGAWEGWAASLPPELSSKVIHLRPTSLVEPGMLVIEPIPDYNFIIDLCERADLRSKIEASLRHWLDRPITFAFRRPEQSPPPPRPRAPGTMTPGDGLADEPIIKLLIEKFEARLVRVDHEENAGTAEP